MMQNRMREMLQYFFKTDKNFINKKKLQDIEYDELDKINEQFYKTKSAIDDITWQDLDMKNVFAKINYTVTTPGEERLYSWLKNPVDNEAEYKKRRSFLGNFQKNHDVSHQLRLNLSKVRYCKYNVKEIMKSAFLVNYYMLASFIVLAIFNFILIAYSLAVKDTVALPILMLTSIINIFIHFRFNMHYGAQLQLLSYVLKILGFCKKSNKLLEEVSPTLASRLQDINSKLKKIANKGRVIFRIEGLDVIADYINIVFLIKEINFLMITDHINKHREEIIEVYDLIGQLDAALSVNRYRDDLQYYCEPIIDCNQESIHMSDMYHPLIDKPTSNSIKITSSIAITGSNMSGKSTFLRTVGLNTLFAQSICTSLSKKHSTGFYRLITSISLNDDILQGKSYFLMEAEAINRMINLKDDSYQSLLLIDEIFKGTNPVERLAASMEILNVLAAGNTKTLVATHDLQILPELVGYEYHYFTEHVTKDALEFDFKIRKGVTTTRNAIKILEFIKYPDGLINKINKRIQEIEV